MDVRINNMTSNLHVSDARAMLRPEVMEQIVQAVLVKLQRHEQEQQIRKHDMTIDRRAVRLDVED